MAKTSSNSARLAGLLLVGCALAAMIGSASATTHVVGGSYGWDVPLTTTFFEEWTKARTFAVGDKLVFPYSPGSNNVMLVEKAEYDYCTANHPMEVLYLGPTTYTLTSPGDYYFFSSFGKHCEYGQKLHVSVAKSPSSSGTAGRRLLAAASSPVYAPAPAPASSSATTATIGAAAVFAGIAASLVSLLM